MHHTLFNLIFYKMKNNVLEKLIKTAKYLPGEKIKGYTIFGAKKELDNNEFISVELFSDEYFAYQYAEHIGSWLRSLIYLEDKKIIKKKKSLMKRLLNSKNETDQDLVLKINITTTIINNLTCSTNKSMPLSLFEHLKISPDILNNHELISLGEIATNNLYEIIKSSSKIDDPYPQKNSLIINYLAVSLLFFLDLVYKKTEKNNTTLTPILFVIIFLLYKKIAKEIDLKKIKTNKLETFLSPDDFIFFKCSEYGDNPKNARHARDAYRNDFLMKWMKFKLAENSNVDLYEEFITQFSLSKLSPPEDNATTYFTKKKTLQKILSQLRKKIQPKE